MSLQQVLQHVVYNDFTGAQSGDTATIDAAITTLYNNSSTAQSMLEQLVSLNKTLTINYVADTMAGDPGEYLVEADLSYIQGLCYINPTGKAIAYDLELVLAHELVHAILGLTDDSPTVPNFAGPTVIYTNTIHDELSEDRRLSYDGAGWTLSANTQYTNGQTIDTAIIAGGSYDADANGHMAGSRDLLIGKSSADTLATGDGNDYLYGQDGDDTLSAGAGDDEITTGNGDDDVVFEFNSTDNDTITDFTIGDDQIDLSAFGMYRHEAETLSVYSGGDTTLYLNGHEIIVEGVTKTDLFNPSNNCFIGLIDGTAGNVVTGTASGETINASDGCTAYNDTITGAGGNDSLYGLAGSDLFKFAPGDGQDTIYETASLSETNVIRLEGIDWEDVYLDNPTVNDFYINIDDGSSGRVKISNQWNGDESSTGYEVTYLQCDDKIIDLRGGLLYRGDGPGQGDTIKARQDADTNDTMDGGDSNDTLYGYGGVDTFVFKAGYGHDTVYDTSGDNVLEIGAYDHYTNNGNDRTYYLDGTNTDWIKIDDFALYSWDVV